jgi:hypothetical protein
MRMRSSRSSQRARIEGSFRPRVGRKIAYCSESGRRAAYAVNGLSAHTWAACRVVRWRLLKVVSGVSNPTKFRVRILGGTRRFRPVYAFKYQSLSQIQTFASKIKYIT